MSETGDPEAPEDRAAPRERAVPRVTLVVAAFMAAAALGIGALGSYMFGDSWVGGVPDAEAPNEIRTGDPTERAAEITGGTPDDGATGTVAGLDPAPGAGTGPETSPADEAFAALIAEEQARLAERARLAADSPLTPAFMETRELIEGWRPKEPDSGTGVDAPSAVRAAPAAGQAGAAPPSPAPDLGPRDGDLVGPTHLLARGSVIPTVLESALDSDLPGLVRAKVAETVFDTLTGGHELIPRGSRLVGSYGSGGRAGQRRLSVAWTDLLLPDGTPVPLGGTGSLGADGASGIKGRRSTGIWTALGAAVLFDIAGSASDIVIAAETGEAPGRQGGLAELLGQAAGNATSEVGQRYIQEILDRGTRFRVGAGTRMNVLVEEDLHLPAQPRGAWR